MEINQEYINKLRDLTNEVLRDSALNPTVKILLETWMATSQILFNELQHTKHELTELKERVKSLELQRNKDSHNSHLPPSRDKNRYPKKTRTSGNPTGGQKGHKGSTLRTVECPGKLIQHKLNGNCHRCGT
jgi:hypothetical protein